MEFRSRRQCGEVPSDADIVARRSEREQQYAMIVIEARPGPDTETTVTERLPRAWPDDDSLVVGKADRVGQGEVGMRILMMGTGPFAVPTFRGLVASAHEVLALITRPVPAPSGRRKSSQPANPMQELAEAMGVPVQAPESIKSPTAIELLKGYRADLLVVCDYGQILPTAALATARLGGINLHGSLLPSYRGAAPINWALYDGVAETGVTVIHMTARLDAGPCLVQRSIPVGASEDAIELERRLAELGWQAVQEALATAGAMGRCFAARETSRTTPPRPVPRGSRRPTGPSIGSEARNRSLTRYGPSSPGPGRTRIGRVPRATCVCC